MDISDFAKVPVVSIEYHIWQVSQLQWHRSNMNMIDIQ